MQEEILIEIFIQLFQTFDSAEEYHLWATVSLQFTRLFQDVLAREPCSWFSFRHLRHLAIDCHHHLLWLLLCGKNSGKLGYLRKLTDLGRVFMTIYLLTGYHVME